MAAWHGRSGVRVDPRRLLQEDVDRSLIFFPERLIPHLHHEAVHTLSPEAIQTVVVRHLHHYLQFTAAFELRVVNRAAERIASGRTGLAVSADARLGAYTIYCDEGYHALASADLSAQVETVTGVPAPAYNADPFVAGLDGVGSELLPDEPALAQLLQVVVFETLVTAILNDIPRDEQVVSAVRDTVRDHARDEGRHHAYFAGLFPELWSQLDRPVRARAARALPELVRRSLAPDLRAPLAALLAAGLAPPVARDVVDEAYAPRRVQAGIRTVARHSVRLFAATGVMDVPGAFEAFAAAGLLAEESR